MAAWVVMMLLAGLLIAAAVTDIRTGKIFNYLTYPAMLIGLVFAPLWGWLDPGSYPFTTGGPGGMFLHSVVAMMAGLIGTGLLVSAGGLHWGDVKLMGAIGAVSASWQIVASTAVYAMVVAAILAVIVMIRRRLVKQTFLRIFGAMLMLGARVKPDLRDDKSPRIPFAVALMIGGLLAAAEVLLKLPTPWAAGWN
ncbi:MAG: prepilin peptidase [Phycisphaerales bacterium]